MPEVRSFGRLMLGLGSMCLLPCSGARADDGQLGGQENGIKIAIEIVAEGTEGWDWTQARTAYVPEPTPWALTTMSRTAKAGSHGYHDVYYSAKRKQGGAWQRWSKPIPFPALSRERKSDGYEVVAGDLWPAWHELTKTILITGKTFNFADGSRENILREKVAYAVVDPAEVHCGPLRFLEMPQADHAGDPIVAPNAGCHQRVDLSDGTILLPIRYQKSVERRVYTTIVALCRFDGSQLTYLEHGSEHTLESGRGLYEPSLIHFDGNFFLTMRADDGAWVASSQDGIHFGQAVPWAFDDGQALGSYNTQQHWVVLAGKLFLVYTRRGLNNDHIMRHRAPLMLAEVDPASLCVKRATEQILVPEDNATLGNSGVCLIGPNECWITVAEGRVSLGTRKGENNRVFVAKVTATHASP